MIRLVAPWATVGPAASRCANLNSLLEQVLGRDDPVDDPPLEHLLGVVEAAGHHELPGPCGARPLRHPLDAAAERGQPDDPLDEPELGALGSPDHVAAERRLQSGGQAQALDQRQRRDRQPLEAGEVGDPLLGERGALGRALDRREGVDVDAAGEDVALGPVDERPRARGGDLVPDLAQALEGPRPEQVQRRVVEHGDHHLAVALEPHRVAIGGPLVLGHLNHPLSARRSARSRRARRRAGSTAASAGRPHSGESRGCGSGRRSASRRRRRH